MALKNTINTVDLNSVLENAHTRFLGLLQEEFKIKPPSLSPTESFSLWLLLSKPSCSSRRLRVTMCKRAGFFVFRGRMPIQSISGIGNQASYLHVKESGARQTHSYLQISQVMFQKQIQTTLDQEQLTCIWQGVAANDCQEIQMLPSTGFVILRTMGKGNHFSDGTQRNCATFGGWVEANARNDSDFSGQVHHTEMEHRQLPLRVCRSKMVLVGHSHQNARNHFLVFSEDLCAE